MSWLDRLRRRLAPCPRPDLERYTSDRALAEWTRRMTDEPDVATVAYGCGRHFHIERMSLDPPT